MMKPGWNTLLAFALAVLCAATTVFAQDIGTVPGDEVFTEEPRELLVLLRAGARSPEEVIDDFNRGLAPIGAVTEVPLAARFAITHRAGGALRQQLAENPESPCARLERWIVLTYPADADLAAAQEALATDPEVELVEESVRATYSVTPNDPLFPDTVSGTPRPPTEHQWGLHSLNLEAAWEWTKGNAYVGLIDTGLDVDHEDLQAFDGATYVGGNFRPHLSWDFASPASCLTNRAVCVDELESGGFSTACPMNAGHGTHVSGIVAATADNGNGVAGTCWHCPLMMARSTITPAQVADAIDWLTDHGVQAISMSFGWPTEKSGIADAIDCANERDVILAAAVGNDLNDVEFPAFDPAVIAAGGVEPGATQGSAQFWERDSCPSTWGSLEVCPGVFTSFPNTTECGSNYMKTPGSPGVELATPAADVLSTFYVGREWNLPLGCGDSTHPDLGYGLCTGTSMSSPHAVALAALVRSVNPLLRERQVRDVLIATASGNGVLDSHLGYGIPDAAAAVQAGLGTVNGNVLPNRLTPLFNLYSFDAETHLSTTIPQHAAAAWFDAEVSYFTKGPLVGGYDQFPGAPCNIGPCINLPRASVYIFASDRAPYAGAPPLVPLYRLSYDAPFGDNPLNRSFAYTTEDAGVQVFHNVGYELDGIEGYIYQRCTPEPSCIPAGAVRLYRLYHEDRDDWAIFPETELATYLADGYASQPGANDWIGYVYLNADADGDHVIDGFEGLIGTDPNDSDSDGDGESDGEEILDFPYSDPLPESCDTVIAEVGQVTNLTNTPQTVVLTRDYINPVVFAQPLSFNGSDTAVVRITNVQDDRFTFYVHEAPDKDGPHTTETVSYLVVEEGTWQLSDGTLLQAGKVNTAAQVGVFVPSQWANVSFSTSFNTPVVMSQVQSNNNPHWVKTRQTPATSTGVQLAMEEEEASSVSHGVETVGWLAIESSNGSWGSHRYEAARTGDSVYDTWYPHSFASSFTQPPRFLAALSSYNGSNPAEVRYNALTATGVQLKIEEDTTFDAEVAHIVEAVSYLAIEGSGQLSVSSCPMAEVGQVTNLTHTPQTVVLTRDYINPVVFAQPLSFNNPDTAVVRITNVQDDRFTFYIHEAPDKDGLHVAETVSYIVVEAGTWQLPNGAVLQAGKLNTAAQVSLFGSSQWANVSFSTTFSNPAVLSQVQSNNNPHWVKTRQTPATSTSVQLAMEEEEASSATHGVETVGWLAINSSNGSWGPHRYEAGRTGDSVYDIWYPLSFASGFTQPPRFLAALSSYNGSNPAAVRYNALSATGVQLKVEEDTTFDAEVAHIVEAVSFFAIEGSGQLSAEPVP